MIEQAITGELLATTAVITTAELQDLAERINRIDRQATEAVKFGLHEAIKAGEALTEAKRIVGHGKWLTWLAANCPAVSSRSDRKYRQIYEAAQAGRLPQSGPAATLGINEVIVHLSSSRRRTAHASDAASSAIDGEDVPDYPGDRLRLMRAALRAIIAIDEAEVFKGLLAKRHRAQVLVKLIDSYEVDDEWRRVIRALQAFKHTIEVALKATVA